jgi:hypothetical protein
MKIYRNDKLLATTTARIHIRIDPETDSVTLEGKPWRGQGGRSS